MVESISGGFDTASTNDGSQRNYKGGIPESSIISSSIENELDEHKKRASRLRIKVTQQERERCLTYMNEQQYIIYQSSKENQRSEKNWIEVSSDVQVRTETIKAKIKDLGPDLFMKSDIDYNFIDKKTAKEERRQFERNQMLAKALQEEIDSQTEDEDQEIYKKVLPRETFDPPVTPDDLSYLWTCDQIRDKLKIALKRMEDIKKIETITSIAKEYFPMELETLISQGEYMVQEYYRAVQKEKERQNAMGMGQQIRQNTSSIMRKPMMMLKQPKIEFCGPDQDDEIPEIIKEKDKDLDRARQMFRQLE